MATVSVRPAGESDFDELTELWERAARPTHAFMTEDAIEHIRSRIRDLLLPSMDVWTAVEGDRSLGFVGARDQHVELLYVDPEAQGRGVGSMLLNSVGGETGPRSVEVYALNTVGVGFYESHGFVVTRTYPSGDPGRPYDVAHLERRGAS